MENREIKFRAWQNGQMCEIDGNSKVTLCFNKISGWNIAREPQSEHKYWLMGDSSKGGEDFILMQYTGLKDQNKNYVYEGDLLQHYIDKRLLIWEVQYRNGVFGIVNINEGHRGNFCPCDGSEYYFKDREIIGNVYENPELLSAKTEA